MKKRRGRGGGQRLFTPAGEAHLETDDLARGEGVGRTETAEKLNSVPAYEVGGGLALRVEHGLQVVRGRHGLEGEKWGPTTQFGEVLTENPHRTGRGLKEGGVDSLDSHGGNVFKLEGHGKTRKGCQSGRAQYLKPGRDER